MSPSTLPPVPVLTLRLSHPNFLDAVLTTSDGEPVYSLETPTNQTTLLRCNPDTDGLEDVAVVSWPEHDQHRKMRSSGVAVQMCNSPVLAENDFLKLHTGVMSASRRFRLPGHERSLRWRRNNGIFECTSPTTSIPIAHFEPAHLTAPAKLKVYVHDLYFKPDFRESQTCGVNTSLLDHLVLTALLLVTNRDDWRLMNNSNSVASSPVSPTSPITPFTSSPISSPNDRDSWYCRRPQSSQSSPSYLAGCPIVRPPSHRPRTSPSIASPSASSITLSPATSIRRSMSTYLHSSQVPQFEEFDASPVLDIRPAFPPVVVAPPTRIRTQSSSRSSRPSTVPALRLHVPSSPLPPSPASVIRRSPLEADADLAFPFLKTDPSDLPPPYEEIEWTVRVRAPRRARSTIGL